VDFRVLLGLVLAGLVEFGAGECWSGDWVRGAAFGCVVAGPGGRGRGSRSREGGEGQGRRPAGDEEGGGGCRW